MYIGLYIINIINICLYGYTIYTIHTYIYYKYNNKKKQMDSMNRILHARIFRPYAAYLFKR